MLERKEFIRHNYIIDLEVLLAWNELSGLVSLPSTELRTEYALV